MIPERWPRFTFVKLQIDNLGLPMEYLSLVVFFKQDGGDLFDGVLIYFFSTNYFN